MRDLEQARAAQHDSRQLLGRVVVEARHVAEAREQGRREQAGARGGCHQRERPQRKLQRLRVRAVAGDDVDAEVFDGGVEVLFDHRRQAMDLVDEQHVALIELGDQRGELALVLDGRARGEHQIDAELLGQDVRQRGLAEAGRTAEEHVIERLLALRGGLHEHLEVLLDLVLPDEVVEARRAQA